MKAMAAGGKTSHFYLYLKPVASHGFSILIKPMETRIYLSLIPEALILSQLPPDKFGMYLAIGNRRQIEGPAVFFEVDPAADLSAFRIDEAARRCVPHADGSPHRSIYVAVYNVIPRVPLAALKKAYLVTPAGFTLAIDPAEWRPEGDDRLFLYQELGPVYPRAVSRLDPRDFCRHVTDPSCLVSLPRLAFIDLKLGLLARDPDAGAAGLPYQHLDHLRECLRTVRDDPGRMTKIVNRGLRPDVIYYLIRSGLSIGDGSGMRYFPIPCEDELASDHYLWWHSARTVKGY
jgi:hypothetical protein